MRTTLSPQRRTRSAGLKVEFTREVDGRWIADIAVLLPLRALMLFVIVLVLSAPVMADELEPSLQLQATVEKAKYCGLANDFSSTLHLRLRLLYRNVGKKL
jgi:hypothetical protein